VPVSKESLTQRGVSVAYSRFSATRVSRQRTARAPSRFAKHTDKVEGSSEMRSNARTGCGGGVKKPERTEDVVQDGERPQGSGSQCREV
jgi:hypothetical protein